MGLFKYIKEKKKSYDSDTEIEQLPEMEENDQFNLSDLREERIQFLKIKLLEEGFYICASEYKNYKNFNGEQNIQKILELLQLWKEESQGLYKESKLDDYAEDHNLKKIEAEDVNIFMLNNLTKIKTLEQKIMSLQIEEEQLREEIITFTNTIQEISNKYKLSPTWEGKKPGLIEKQKELVAKREAYEEKENFVNGELQQFVESCQPIIKVIRDFCKGNY